MKIQSCEVKNFASYGELEFNFDNKGLSLIHGPTGSGKSTLCDIVPWALFGKTSKGGAVDEILSWPGDKVTSVTLNIEKDGNLWSIFRSRGSKSKDNDLYYYSPDLNDGPIVRGKDLQDTQKLINQMLGLDYELYLSGSYFHEFSQSSQFFTTTAKNRRFICEQLVDLSLPKKLQERVSSDTKLTKAELQNTHTELRTAQSNYDLMSKMREEESKRAAAWAASNDNKHEVLASRRDAFQEDKNNQILSLKIKIDNISTKPDIEYTDILDALKSELPPESEPCKECGVPKHNELRSKKLKEIEFVDRYRQRNLRDLEIVQELKRRLSLVEEQENTYQIQIDELLLQVNPHEQTLSGATEELGSKDIDISKLKSSEESLLTKRADLDILTDALVEFRNILIRNTILDLEDKTNVLLSNHFDAEIKIQLNIEDADKLEVSIIKDGNSCSYTQLSKGQRQILKLCFGLSVMRSVANHSGVKFNSIWLDECCDGMDDINKMRAVKMLETLAIEYDSIYLVEHSSEIKAYIDNKYKVELINGHSHITKE